MGCKECGKPKCNGECGCKSPKVLQINNPAEYITFHKVSIPAAMGDSTTNPPKIGAYRNALVYYEADHTSWMYSTDGIPTLVTGEQGPQGLAGTIAVGTTTTGEPGSNASVENVGTPENAILNFTVPQGPRVPEEEVQDDVNNKLDEMVEDGTFTDVLNGMSYYVNPKTFGAVGDGTTDDTQALQDCIDYANTNQLAVELDRKRYKITDSLTIYSKLHIYGNGSEIVLDADKAIFTSEDILHHVMIENICLTGANDSTKTSNNGIELVCYYSTFKGIEFKNLYSAIRLIVGSATGTLVENRIENCNVRDCQQGFYIGALNNNKLTDGFIKNCIIKTVNDTLYAIYIGSGAGWIIDGVHVYGKNKYGLRVANSFNTNISNIYVESRSEVSINLDTMQTTTSLDNVSIVLSKPDGIGISQSASGYIPFGTPWLNVSNCLINAWQSVTSAVGIQGSKVQLSNSHIYSASVSGFTPINVTSLRYVADANVEGNLANKNDRLRYQGQGLGICIKHFVDSGSTQNTLRVKVPETMVQYDMYIFNFRLLGYENWNGTKNFDYASEIVLINKNNVPSVKNITSSSTTNFSVAPSVSYDSSTNELVITFTPGVHLYGTYMITG